MPWSRSRHTDEETTHTTTHGAHEAHDAPPPASTTPTSRTEAGRAETTYVERRDDDHAHQKFGGINWGAAFFGWLVAVGMLVVLTAIASMIATAVGANIGLSENEATREAQSIGLGAAIAAVVILGIAHYCGGYAAGRMSRFDGAKQGLAVWIIGLVITVLAVVAGWLLGSEYNVANRVNLPQLPLSADTMTIGGIVTGIVILAVTLLGAILGGKMGHRYHNRVDRAAYHH